jgi:zinc transport system ATP-binding protein
MGISKLAGRRIGQLSGGQKQRVFVAKAIVRNPEILILDEPAAGVDHEAEERFNMKLSDLNKKQGTTILIVSHDLAAVFCRMNRVMCINKKVYTSDITPEADPNEILKKAYGDHFHFVFHEHTCEGIVEDV